MSNVKTLVIDNFNGTLTSYQDGDINSGLTNGINTFGNDPFSQPGNLTWAESAVAIDPTGVVITDLIMAGKERVESGILYVYAIGHTGRLYKIQVNDPTTFDPDYDNPVLVTTLTINTPTFTRGGFMEFFGTSEQIYIGHDKGVTKINFDGTSEAFVGALGSWTQTVPRPLKQFVGNLYAGNGNNIAEIIQAGTVSTYAKLSPSFPLNTQVRDMDVAVNGTYLEAVVTRLALPDITVATQDTVSTASTESYIFKWNGVDTGYTSFDTFPSFLMTANTMFGPYQYTFGTDQYGMGVFNPTQKIITATGEFPPLPNAVTSSGNLVSWMAPLYYGDHLELTQAFFGPLDRFIGTGYWAQFGHTATLPETDIVQVPCQILVSNFGQGTSSNGYTDNIFSTAKVYFSTLETSGAPTIKYRFHKWSPIATGTGTVIPGAIYQTQKQLFSKKVKVSEVRIYGDGWTADNSFQFDLVGSAATPFVGGITALPGSTKLFEAGTTLEIGTDYAWYTPDCPPTYALGVAITNVGTKNLVISKIEIDYTEGGK